MALRVVGAGLGRTGTTSLQAALQRLLDAPCHHMFEVAAHQEQVPVWRAACRGEAVDWDELLGGYAAVVDWPGVAFWRELTDRYPDALVLVSNRDFDGWYDSARATIFAHVDPDSDDPWHAFIADLFASRFTLDLDDRDAVRRAFESHYAAVREAIAPERRLEWTPGDGWEPLCAALDLPVPDEPFPHLNLRQEWA